MFIFIFKFFFFFIRISKLFNLGEEKTKNYLFYGKSKISFSWFLNIKKKYFRLLKKVTSYE